MIQSVVRSVYSPSIRRLSYSAIFGPTAPVREKLLLTLRPTIFGEDVILDDIYAHLGEDVPIVAYIIPEDMRTTMFAKLGAGLWFDSAGTAKQVNCIELAQSPEINQWAVWYRLDAAAGLGNREVLFYDHDTLLEADVAKIAAWFKEPGATSYPSAFFNGLDFRLATYTGGPTYAPDNLGVLRTPGSNLPAVHGMRLATTVADGAVLGPELEQYGDFSVGFVTWTAVNCTAVVGVDGVTCTVTDSYPSLQKNKTYVTGKKHLISVEYDYGTIPAGKLAVSFWDGIDFAIPGSGTGTYDFYITPTASYTKLVVGALSGLSAGQIFRYVKISVKEVIPTYITTDSSGDPIIASTPQRTVTYSTDWTTKTFAKTFYKFDISNPLLAPGFLCEPVRTNYLLYSNNFSNVYWTKLNLTTSTSSDVFAPDGTPATLLTVNANATYSFLSSRFFSLPVGVFTISRYLKAGTSRYCTLGLHSLPDAYFDLQNFTYSFLGTYAIGATIAPVDDGWILISATWNVTVANTYAAYFAFANSLTTQVNVLGSTLYSWGHQLELGAFKTSRIPTTTATATRAETIASFPTAGKIPVNDFAIRMIVVPRASGQNGVYLFGSYVDASNSFAVLTTSTSIVSRKRSINADTDASVSLTHANGVPIDIVIVSTTSGGMQVSARTYSGSWGSFTNGTVNAATEAKANAQIGSTYQLGALNGAFQFTGNISLFDCVPIPAGTADPMAWAKTHWGVE